MKIFIADNPKVGWKRVSNLLNGVHNIELTGSDINTCEVVNDIEEEKPDVLIFDIDIPVKKGLELLEQIHREHSFLTVIVLTNASCSFFRRKCLEAGAKFYFDKATEFSQVQQAVEALAKGCHPLSDTSNSISN